MDTATRWNDEHVINVQIGEILCELNPQWDKGGLGSVIVENTRTLTGSCGKKTDFVAISPNRVPVIIESEYYPAHYLSYDDMASRIGEKLNDGSIIEQVIGLRIPRKLGEADQSDLKDQVLNSRFEYCVVSKELKGNSTVRWPVEGWLEGGVRDFAEFIEYASLAENLINRL